MVEKYNFTTPFLEHFIYELNCRKCKGVVWIGMHPWISLVYQLLLDLKIPLLAVMDNNPAVQGNTIIPYKKWFSTLPSFERKIVRSVAKIDGDDIVYFMANTHYKEISEQLKGLGVDFSCVVNLYDDTREHIKYKAYYDRYTINRNPLNLKEIQKIEIELLKDFRDFCDENHYRYFIGGGTLIGAIRHNGFIPWDDDIDVYMPYEDYIKFLDNYNGKYTLLDWRKEKDYVLQFAQLVTDNTVLFREFDWMWMSSKMSVFIDIFPMAGYPSDRIKIENKWESHRNLDGEIFYFDIMNDVKGINIVDTRYEISAKRQEYKFDDSNYVGSVFHSRQNPWVSRRELFEKTVELKFEGEYFKAPAGYDEHLTYRYGEYMKLPPLESREQHLFPCFMI